MDGDFDVLSEPALILQFYLAFPSLSDFLFSLTTITGLNRLTMPIETHPEPEPAVLVIGDFEEGGFAHAAWTKIEALYKHITDDEQPTDTTLPKQTRRTQPYLRPEKVDDCGCAGHSDFAATLYSKFREFSIWGVISCCTARNSAKLLEVLEPIDVPILICVDNTVADQQSALSRPNVLQLVPNNALQAQAILGKVGAELPAGDKEVTVNVYCRQPQDDFVKDLWKALDNKSRDSQNKRFRLKQIIVGRRLREAAGRLKDKDIIVYLGYRDGLRKVVKTGCGKNIKVFLSDACYETKALQELKSIELEHEDHNKKPTSYIAVPSFDPSIYACQAYIALSEAWRHLSLPDHHHGLDKRLTSTISYVRSYMEDQPLWSYRFVGVANQSGGYICTNTREVELEETTTQTTNKVK